MMTQNLMFGVLFGAICGVLLGFLNFPIVTQMFDTIDVAFQSSIGLSLRLLLNETIMLGLFGAGLGFLGGMLMGTGRTAT